MSGQSNFTLEQGKRRVCIKRNFLLIWYVAKYWPKDVRLKSYRPVQFRRMFFSFFIFFEISTNGIFTNLHSYDFQPSYSHIIKSSIDILILPRINFCLVFAYALYRWLYEGLRNSLLNQFHFILELANSRVIQKTYWTISLNTKELIPKSYTSIDIMMYFWSRYIFLKLLRFLLIIVTAVIVLIFSPSKF